MPTSSGIIGLAYHTNCEHMCVRRDNKFLVHVSHVLACGGREHCMGYGEGCEENGMHSEV